MHPDTKRRVEIAGDIRRAQAQAELTVGAISPERRLVERVREAVVTKCVEAGTDYFTADDVAELLDGEGVERTALAQRRRLVSVVINGGRHQGLWTPSGKVRSSDRRRHGREITLWRRLRSGSSNAN